MGYSDPTPISNLGQDLIPSVAGQSLLTLQNLNQASPFPPTDTGIMLAFKAMDTAKTRNTYGHCYSAVADDIDYVSGKFLHG